MVPLSLADGSVDKIDVGLLGNLTQIKYSSDPVRFHTLNLYLIRQGSGEGGGEFITIQPNR